jgi:hypothetical protein
MVSPFSDENILASVLSAVIASSSSFVVASPNVYYLIPMILDDIVHCLFPLIVYTICHTHIQTYTRIYMLLLLCM